jgi:hypothetical protein
MGQLLPGVRKSLRIFLASSVYWLIRLVPSIALWWAMGVSDKTAVPPFSSYAKPVTSRLIRWLLPDYKCLLRIYQTGGENGCFLQPALHASRFCRLDMFLYLMCDFFLN